MKKEYFYEALDLFRTRYGKFPLVAGFPAVSMYKRQKAFIFGHSAAHIRAFRRRERLYKWLYIWALPLTTISLIVMLFELFINPSAMTILQFVVLGCISSVVLLILGIFFRKNERIAHGKVIWIKRPSDRPVYL